MNYILFKRAQKTVFEDIILYQYVLRRNSAATSAVQRYKVVDPLKVISIIEQDSKENEEWHSIVYNRYLRSLINVSQQTVSKEDAKQAKRQLASEMQNKKVFHSESSSKLRLMALGAVKLPGCYRVIRKVYDIITGAGTKFKI